jgi:hypothetical protein
MFVQELVQSVLDLPGQFLDVAMHDPLGAVLLIIGATITTASVAFFGLLVLGSVLDLFTPSGSSPPPQRGR